MTELEAAKAEAERLKDALRRITVATANSTNSADLPQFISWVRAVADTALDDRAAISKALGAA